MKINLHSAVIALSLASWIQQAAAQVQSPTRPESGSRLPTVTVTSERVGSFKSDSVQGRDIPGYGTAGRATDK